MITITIKQRSDSGQWKHISAVDLEGKTLLMFFQQSVGAEIVTEVNIDGRRMFFCGTDYWLERMKQKGDAVSFADAIQRLKQINPELLAEKLPALEIVCNVFEGCQVVEHKILDPK